MDPVKVAGVAQWPTPTNRKEVQSFLGFANFYRRFIKDFSHHARPLFDLTKSSTEFSWSPAAATAFQSIKDAVTSSPVLAAPNDDLPFRLEADSSDFATGAVLSQQSPEDGKWHPIAFFSKSLSPVERNYEIHDKEMLAIIRALQEWRHFLEGARHKFEIWTDHKNLEYFMSSQNLNRRQARWSLTLACFDFVMQHKAGATMGKADALSRRSDHGSSERDNQNITLLTPGMFAVRALEGLEFVGQERSLVREIRRHSKEASDLEDTVAKAVKALRKTGSQSLRSSEWDEADGLIYFCGKLYVPPGGDLRRRIVALCHDSTLAGHPGCWKTLELVSRNYWWPRMSKFIGLYTSTCDMCLRTKTIRQRPLGELEPLAVPDRRWDHISVDFIVELPESNGYDAIMVVVDSLSKRAHFTATTTTVSALGTARMYRDHIWKLHGLPSKVVSDRGPQFIAEFTTELYRLLGIEPARSTAYHPQTDGQTERVNQELEQYLRLYISERQDDWYDILSMAEFAYNNHVHSSTQQTPFLLDSGQHPRMGFEPLPPSRMETVNEFTDRMKTALEEARAALAAAKEDMARYYNRRRTKAPEIKPGDRVYLDASDIQTTRPSKKLSHKRVGPYPVISSVGKNAYRLQLPKSLSRIHPVFHVVRLTPAPYDPISGRRAKLPPPPVLVDNVEEFVVEKILNSKFIRGKLRYLIKWEGYDAGWNSWEPADDVHAPDLIKDFYAENPKAPKVIRTTYAHIPYKQAGLHASRAKQS